MTIVRAVRILIAALPMLICVPAFAQRPASQPVAAFAPAAAAAHGGGGGADENDPGLGASFGKGGIFRQEAVAGVNGLGI